MKYKIKAEQDGERIIVNATFFQGSKKVHELNEAFTGLTAEEVEAEVKKAGELFEKEQEVKEEQQKLDKERELANNTVNNLNKQNERKI